MKLSVDHAELRIDLATWEKLLAVRVTPLLVPLTSIERASAQAREFRWFRWKEIRAPGTFLPGVIKSGTYRWRNRKEFWSVTRGSEVLTIDLKEGPYTRIVLGLKDSQQWVQHINDALADKA